MPMKGNLESSYFKLENHHKGLTSSNLISRGSGVLPFFLNLFLVPKLFYYHVGNEVRINKRGFFSWTHNKILDHKIENYLSNLEKL